MIRAIREHFIKRMTDKGFTGTKLAEVTGISQGFISQVINGEKTVLAPTANKIIKALDCSFDEIFTVNSAKNRGISIKHIDTYINKKVYFDTGQYTFEGKTTKEYIFNGYVVRKDKNGKIYYQAELKESKHSRNIILAALEKILTEDEIE